MPVSNFVSALVGPMLDADYRDAMQVCGREGRSNLWTSMPHMRVCDDLSAMVWNHGYGMEPWRPLDVDATPFLQFFFAFAFVAWLLLFSLTFFKAVLKKEDDDRQRGLLAIWVAAPAVMAVAYLQVMDKCEWTDAPTCFSWRPVSMQLKPLTQEYISLPSLLPYPRVLRFCLTAHSPISDLLPPPALILQCFAPGYQMYLQQPGTRRLSQVRDIMKKVTSKSGCVFGAS